MREGWGNLMSVTPERLVPVQIMGQRYPIKSTLEERYIAELATYVDEKMREAADVTPGSDSLRLAVVTALNIADEFFRCRDADRSWQQGFMARTQRIEQIVDEALTPTPGP